MLDKPRQKHDWPVLLAEFEGNVGRDSSYTLKKFSDQKGMTYEMCSREFTELRRQRAIEFMDKAKDKLLTSSIPIVNRLVGIAVDSPDENVASRTGLGLLDRMGLSPQVAQVQVTQQVMTQIAVQPMFAEKHKADIDAVFETMPEEKD